MRAGLFQVLDGDGDGSLCRDDLHVAARALGWHWREAPVYAVLDRLLTDAPLDEATFLAVLEQMGRDPWGPYGDVLLRAPARCAPVGGGNVADEQEGLPALLERCAGAAAAESQADLETRLPDVAVVRGALLVIDPQRSFTQGAWMRSMGPGAQAQAQPIQRAFRRCAARLGELGAACEVAFTRCPFPPASYDWDPAVAAVTQAMHPYFVKPGNSALWPLSNGYASWVESLLRRGLDTLVFAGCTLNSCVRVTALQTLERFESQGLRVVTDLALCGARSDNYRPSAQFGGRSSVVAAVQEMEEAGVVVARACSWRLS